MLANGQAPEDLGMLERAGQPAFRPQLWRRVGDIVPVQPDFTVRGADQAGEDAEQGALAGPVGPHQADQLPGRDLDGGRVDGQQPPVSDGDPGAREAWRWRPGLGCLRHDLTSGTEVWAVTGRRARRRRGQKHQDQLAELPPRPDHDTVGILGHRNGPEPEQDGRGLPPADRYVGREHRGQEREGQPGDGCAGDGADPERDDDRQPDQAGERLEGGRLGTPDVHGQERTPDRGHEGAQAPTMTLTWTTLTPRVREAASLSRTARRANPLVDRRRLTMRAAKMRNTTRAK